MQYLLSREHKPLPVCHHSLPVILWHRARLVYSTADKGASGSVPVALAVYCCPRIGGQAIIIDFFINPSLTRLVRTLQNGLGVAVCCSIILLFGEQSVALVFQLFRLHFGLRPGSDASDNAGLQKYPLLVHKELCKV